MSRAGQGVSGRQADGAQAAGSSDLAQTPEGRCVCACVDTRMSVWCACVHVRVDMYVSSCECVDMCVVDVYVHICESV